MSWVDDIRSELVIQTGDGQNYTVLWLNASREVSWNIAKFEFPSIAGTLVRRSERKGIVYNAEFYFQGDDNLVEAEAFRISADDPRPWIISHPFYKRIIVQPSSLKFDNSQYNITRITGSLTETIEDVGVRVGPSTPDVVQDNKFNSDESAAQSFESPAAEDVAQISGSADSAFGTYREAATTDAEFSQLTSLYQSARVATNSVISEPIIAMRQAQALFSYPAAVARSLEDRITFFRREFDNLVLSTANTFGLKQYFERTGGTIISAICVALVNPIDGDYTTRGRVERRIADLTSIYDAFIVRLDAIQGDDYYPNGELIRLIDNNVNLTISRLYEIALNSQQERTITLEKDSDVITLAHRFYGVASEENILRMTNNNNIGLSEILNIPKGREIVYYV